MLRVDSIEVRYGQARAIDDISIEVHDGESVAIIGRNGAGKTTLLSAIAGMLPLVRGAVTYGGASINRLAPHRIVRLGLSLVPQERFLFDSMAVEENLELGARGAGARREDLAGRFEYVYGMFPVLYERRHDKARSLSGGQQQMVAIGRALMGRPKMLMLDEPSTGLAPAIVDELGDRISALRGEGMALLLVEQDVELALDLVDRGYLMANGRIAGSGTAAELRNSDGMVRTGYLGVTVDSGSPGLRDQRPTGHAKGRL